MVEKSIIEQIRNDFKFVLDNPRILGVLLFGSYLTGDNSNRSDIDICVVSDNEKIIDTYNYIMVNLKKNIDKYDIRFFQELPLYIKGEIIDNGRVIICSDEPALYEYFFYYRKLWREQQLRIKYLEN